MASLGRLVAWSLHSVRSITRSYCSLYRLLHRCSKRSSALLTPSLIFSLGLVIFQHSPRRPRSLFQHSLSRSLYLSIHRYRSLGLAIVPSFERWLLISSLIASVARSVARSSWIPSLILSPLTPFNLISSFRPSLVLSLVQPSTQWLDKSLALSLVPSLTSSITPMTFAYQCMVYSTALTTSQGLHKIRSLATPLVPALILTLVPAWFVSLPILLLVSWWVC